MSRCEESLEAWIEGNMFAFRKGDGAAYFVFYILIPVAITVISLMVFPENDVQAVYCYVTILVSALNCIYDAANRWCTGVKAVRNSKLFIVIASTVVVAAYCIVVILGILITETTSCRCDYCLLVYLITVAVAFADIIACFGKEMAWRACVVSANIEGE